jgi:predicted ATP-dependent endonuclease of OLD family
MKITKIRIKNYRSIKDSGDIDFVDNLFVLAGQNESGKSSILEAMEAYENEIFDADNINFEEFQNNNNKQEISCSYEIDNPDDFIDNLESEIKDQFKIDADEFLDTKKLKEKFKCFTISKEFDHSVKTEQLKLIINSPAIDILKASIKQKEHTTVSEVNGEQKQETKKEPFIDLGIEKNIQMISKILFELTPEIILFNDFSDLLPDRILIADLENKNQKAQGYKAVRNLEKLLKKDLVSIAKLTPLQKTSATDQQVNLISVTFQEDWKQKVYGNNEVKIKFQIEADDKNNNQQTVFFSIETKDGVFLEPRKRSKGMIWFLSSWLELKAQENSNKLVILYDEPGLYLHIKAQKDMLNVFKRLTKNNGHQVIYSTHLSSLIDTDNLGNIGLVLNSKESGTSVEGLTTSKINTENKKDALQPISEAMGLEPLKDFSILGEKNILLEGLSDFWYFNGMKEILNIQKEYKFVPGIGIKNGKIYPLISFCIGYGLDWVLIMDDGKNSKETKKEIIENIFGGEDLESSKKVKIIEGINGIENMFTCNDLKLINDNVNCSKKEDDMSKIVGAGRKILFAKEFFQKVKSKEILKTNLDKETIKKWEDIFQWIDERY